MCVRARCGQRKAFQAVVVAVAVRVCAMAAVPEPETPPAEHGITAWADEQLDPLQAGLSTNFLAAVAWFDRMFGDNRLVDDADDSRMTLAVGVKVSRFEGASFEHRTRATLGLPHLRDRLLLVWDQLTETGDIDDATQVLSAYENSAPDLGLRIYATKPNSSRLSLGAGLRLGSESQAYGRLRGSRTLSLWEGTELYLSQTLQYYSENQWSAIANTRLSWACGNRWILQANPRLTWREIEDGHEPLLMLSAMRMIGRMQAFRLDVGGSWPNTPHSRETRYFVQGAERWRLGRDWLFGDLAVGVGFPQTERFEPDPYVRAMVEVVLGKAKYGK